MKPASLPRSTRAGDPAAGAAADGFSRAATRFIAVVPALLAGTLCLRAWALAACTGPATSHWGALTLHAVGADLLLFAHSLPLLFLLSWPLLMWRRRVLGGVALALLWTLWLGMQIALEQYFLVARVPLGADLFGYSLAEVRTTAAGARMDAVVLLGWLLPVATLWLALAWRMRRPPLRSSRVAAGVLATAALLWLVPVGVPSPATANEDVRALALNKTASFLDDAWHHLRAGHNGPLPLASAASAPSTGKAAGAESQVPLDPRYPFLRPERTPDVLGAHFNADPARPPHLVFILVEGLGRSFSGPDAPLGSFTPFLDDLGGRGLYWSNFLANQGRTFAALPSVFGSLPFGEQGYAALGERMPAHAGLLSVLERNGYRSRFYYGSNADFDHERIYLQRQGVDRIVDQAQFGPGYRLNPFSSWGYDDHQLIARVLADPLGETDAPTVSIIQTMSMHSSYRFPGQEKYLARFERRLDELGIADDEKARYRQFQDIYASILLTDDALRRYFAAVAHDPAYANTVFVITGDHRLPEIPMDTRIERYHVPLIVFSPMLRQPQRIRSVSSHLDIAPSLLAWLSHQFGLKRPERVTWVGTGLDMEPGFRNVHDIPLKQTKTTLGDFASGQWFVSRDQLYRLHDGMRIEPSTDANGVRHVSQRFAAFRDANDRFAREPVLSPDGAAPALVAYDAQQVAATSTVPVAAAEPLRVREVRVGDAASGGVEVTAVFANDGATTTPSFVPLLVLTGEDGRELGESYGAALQLAPGAHREVRLRVETAHLAAGRYYLAVVPSHPETGRSIGAGRYRVPLRIRG